MTPLLYSVWFRGTGPHADSYGRFARVLEYSAKRHCPDWQVEVIARPPLPKDNREHFLGANTDKLTAWVERLASCPDDQPVLFSDTDMAVLKPLDPLWDLDFDLAYTTRPSRLFFNGGVLALRVNDRTRTFMDAYLARNNKMLADPKYHAPYRRRYGGMNQAAFGSLFDDLKSKFNLKAVAIPGVEWNCEQTTWGEGAKTGKTRLLHCKGQLRKAILYKRAPSGRVAGIVHFSRQWATLERQALGDAPSSLSSEETTYGPISPQGADD